ncbi:phosphodiester glycosidase family protein [Pseudooceanicola sp.]|uniref:phosphodiester glycosidase family protein n=1 Tax=Pseudooceanicola sp. TaxID=1914328 RepID=UPI002611F23A|nr:phosphodiester glycosidase family protein [Pseudooceanicola sp.]MDF1856683.1 phosphodiester glycosidase family protein [Pseudooceanicola sp.]
MNLAARLLLALGLLGASAGAGTALECRVERFRDKAFSLCEVAPARDDLRLFLYDDDGAPYGQFDRINAGLSGKGQRLGFAMNAGMYHENRAPVGHYVENGQEVMRVIANPGPGNFGMVPNGVFCIREGRAEVMETHRFMKTRKGKCRFATQSGPMLVIDGQLHPRFLPDSTSRYLRNGVGTSDSGDRAVFVISHSAVTFHEFASFFRDALHLPQALYFDGNVSRLYAPDLGRSDAGRQMGPVVGVVSTAD